MAKAPVRTASTRVTPEPEGDLPESVTLESVHAFYDDDGLLRMWPAGIVETDPTNVALLIERGAPLKD